MLKPALCIVGIGIGAVLIFQTPAYIIEMRLNRCLRAGRVPVLQSIVDGAVLGEQFIAGGALFEHHTAIVKHALLKQLIH